MPDLIIKKENSIESLLLPTVSSILYTSPASAPPLKPTKSLEYDIYNTNKSGIKSETASPKVIQNLKKIKSPLTNPTSESVFLIC